MNKICEVGNGSIPPLCVGSYAIRSLTDRLSETSSEGLGNCAQAWVKPVQHRGLGQCRSDLGDGLAYVLKVHQNQNWFCMTSYNTKIIIKFIQQHLSVFSGASNLSKNTTAQSVMPWHSSIGNTSLLHPISQQPSLLNNLYPHKRSHPNLTQAVAKLALNLASGKLSVYYVTINLISWL